MRLPLTTKYLALLAGFLVAIASLFLVVKRQWEKSLEAGYIAFNDGSYSEARDRLSLLAEAGEERAQQLMGYMSGLGLGGPVDFGDALRWMRKGVPRGVDARTAVGEQAYYLGRDAVEGLYGSDKVEIGHLWLHIADLSGCQLAAQLLSQEKRKGRIGGKLQ